MGADEFERNENSTASTFQKNKTSTSTSEFRRKKCKKNNVTPFQRELLSALNNPEEENNFDPDRAFLVSLLPDYKRLTYEQKTDFRLMTLQYFKQISLEVKQSQPLYDVHHNATYPSVSQAHYTSQLTLPILSTYTSTSDLTINKVPPRQAQHSMAFSPLHSSGSYLSADQDNANTISDYYKNYQ